jgi:hypothetical protein
MYMPDNADLAVALHAIRTDASRAKDTPQLDAALRLKGALEGAADVLRWRHRTHLALTR